MSLFREVGRRVEQFKRQVEDAADEGGGRECDECGARLDAAADECPECGSPVTGGDG